jgi:hypothetical protein
MTKFSVRDLFLVLTIVGLGTGWWVDRSRLHAKASDLHRHLVDSRAEIDRLKKSPSWAGMDRIMDLYALRFAQLQKRERQLGLSETASPFDAFEGDPRPGDAVPSVPPVIFPKDRSDDGR